MGLTGFDHSVRWDEFTTRTSRPEGVDEDAQIRTRTVSGGFRSHQPHGEECRVVSVDIGLSVDRTQTWVIDGRQSDALLKHEQGHYDIVALGTRELYNRVLQLTAPRCSDINTRVQQLQREIQAAIDAADDRYDSRTDHGNNAVVQQTWDTRLRAAKQSATGTLADLPT
jgi:predicted secreted Zn-dependent protease